MNSILLRSPKIIILRILDKYLEILEDCKDLNHNNSSLSRLYALVLSNRKSIKHK
jgi:hypothetical protein